MAVSANRLELLQIADAVAREKSIDREIVIPRWRKQSKKLPAPAMAWILMFMPRLIRRLVISI